MGIDPEAFAQQHTTELSLGDGLRVRIRPIVPADRSVLEEAFAHLSVQSRQRRFFTALRELTPEMLREFTEVDYDDRFAWVALALDPTPVPAGVARYIRTSGDRQVAEAAVTVVDDYQHRGLGSVLLSALTLEALGHGIVRFRGQLLTDNEPMRGLLRHAGAHLERDSPGVLRFEVDLPASVEDLRASPLYSVLRAVAGGSA